jgi:predicted enzyme related to lactoylglutathione lyase
MNSDAPIPIRAVDFVMYCSQDVRKLRAWYQRLFGLEPGDEWHRGWSELDTQPVTLCINGSDKDEPEAWEWRKGAALAFAVDDILAAAAACRRRRVRGLAGPIETGVCWMLFVEDPEGNPLVLHQRKDGTAG